MCAGRRRADIAFIGDKILRGFGGWDEIKEERFAMSLEQY
jgi:hypothetical protein